MPLRFRSDIAKGIIIAPQNYLPDLASIPQFAWTIYRALRMFGQRWPAIRFGNNQFLSPNSLFSAIFSAA
ncbi:MAG TPA: hypothetical protein VGM58_07865 [Verrucomicrobiae bacterium]